MSVTEISPRTFGTLMPAMVTPFTVDGEVDYQAAGELANTLVDGGCDGILVTGTTGETPTSTNEENLGMFQAVIDAVAAVVPYMPIVIPLVGPLMLSLLAMLAVTMA